MIANDVDIAIVGGGLVGAPLAIMLARLGWSVALLEQNTDINAKPGTRGYTALSDSTVRVLSSQQLWTTAASDACAIKKVHVSHKGYFGSTQIDSDQLNVDALGYVVDNVALLQSFQTTLEASSEANAVQQINGALVTQLEHGANMSTLHYEQENNAHTLQARLVIAVDGVSSRIRKAANIASEKTDYDQVGILGLVNLAEPHNNIAYERFTPSGPLAFLPRPNNTASYVYCIDPSMQDDLQSQSDEAFLESLQAAFGYRLGKFESAGQRYFVPLVRVEAKQRTAQRLLLMGNAYRLLHPVAGQGYNLAMRDVEALVRTLSDVSIDPGAVNVLQDFSNEREPDHSQVVRMTDGLARTFRGSASIPAHIRALGLIGLDRLPPLRNRFTQRSMGNTR